MDTNIKQLGDIKTETSNMNDINKQTQDDSNVALSNDLFTLNDQDDTTQQLDQNIDDTGVGDETEVENDDLLDDDDDALAQTNGDSDDLDFSDATMGLNDDTSAKPDEVDRTRLGLDTNEMNFLGDDMEESILDSPGSIYLNTDEQQEHDSGVDGDDDFQQQQQQEDDEDETVEKTWDMVGADADDDQENSSVDALLDAGEDSFNDNNVESVINDDTFVVDELAETTKIDKESSSDADNQPNWNNENTELARGDEPNTQDVGQQTWNEDDDTEAEAEEEQEETMEQGTVEENENDRLGATLENALDALELEQDTLSSSSLPPPSPMTVDSGKDFVVDDLNNHANSPFGINNDNASPYSDTIGKSTALVPPPQQQEQSSLELDSAGELASIDTSLVLLVAVFILLCLRLPYVKRFFVKIFKSQETSTLPYHTAHSKELD